MDYITKEAAQKCLDDLTIENLIGNENDTFISLAEAKDRIEELPTADVVPRERFDRVFGNLKAVLEERSEDKAEVAAEVIDDIWNFVESRNGVGYVSIGIVEIKRRLYELKKKYTEAEPPKGD